MTNQVHNLEYDMPDGSKIEFPVGPMTVIPAATPPPPPPPPPSSGPNIPVGIGVGALVFDGKESGWSQFSRDRNHGWKMNGVQPIPQNVQIQPDGSVILSLSDATHGAYMGTSTQDGGNGFGLPARCVCEYDALVSLRQWNALWASGPNWPAGGEPDVVEVLNGIYTTNWHDSVDPHNSGPIDTNYVRRTYTVVRDTAQNTVYWAGKQVQQYPTDGVTALEGLIMNVGQGALGFGMQVWDARVWALT